MWKQLLPAGFDGAYDPASTIHNTGKSSNGYPYYYCADWYNKNELLKTFDAEKDELWGLVCHELLGGTVEWRARTSNHTLIIRWTKDTGKVELIKDDTSLASADASLYFGKRSVWTLHHKKGGAFSLSGDGKEMLHADEDILGGEGIMKAEWYEGGSNGRYYYSIYADEPLDITHMVKAVTPTVSGDWTAGKDGTYTAASAGTVMTLAAPEMEGYDIVSVQAGVSEAIAGGQIKSLDIGGTELVLTSQPQNAIGTAMAGNVTVSITGKG